MSSTTTLFKVHHRGDIRRLRVGNTNQAGTAPRVGELMAALVATFEPVSVRLPVFWQDEEGDFITVKTDADLDEAVRAAAGKLVRLMVNPDAANQAEAAAPAPPPAPAEFLRTTLNAAAAAAAGVAESVGSIESAAERGAELAAEIFEPHWKAMMQVTDRKAFGEVRKAVKASIEQARSELKGRVQTARTRTKATIELAQASLRAFDATVKTCREKLKSIVGAWKAAKDAEKEAKQAAKQAGADAAACEAAEPPDSFIDEHDALMILAAMKPGSATQCPGCALIIEKVDGDDTMMCGCEGKPAGGTMEKALAAGGCGVEFNFATGALIGQGKPGAPANARQWKFSPDLEQKVAEKMRQHAAAPAGGAEPPAVEPPTVVLNGRSVEIDGETALMILAAMKPGSATQCPACELIIEKVDGDDTMMCGCEARPAGGTMEKALAGGGCGHEFNFVTGAPIGQGKPGAPANARQWKFFPSEPAPAPEPEPAEEPSTAEPSTAVLRAWYGHPDAPHFEPGAGGLDLTAVAAGFVRDGVLTLPASNKVGGDPAVGVRKVLVVEYRDRAGDIKTAAAQEGDAVQVEVWTPAPTATAAEPDWACELAVLTTMGFTDEELLSTLLVEHKGSVQHVVASIL